MPLINYAIDILLTWSEECITVTGDYGSNDNHKPNFAITDTKLYVPAVTVN